jgi:EVE domain
MGEVANFVAVASAEHVAIGRVQGFMQVGHGKGAPLKRLHAGDRIAYYSPVRVFGSKDACQAFTAIGTVRDERVYQSVHKAPGLANTQGHPPSGCGPAWGGPALVPQMAGSFEPFRKDVEWLEAAEAPIRPLLERLSFTQGKSNWGYAFRFGLLKVTADDMALIAQAMQAPLTR